MVTISHCDAFNSDATRFSRASLTSSIAGRSEEPGRRMRLQGAVRSSGTVKRDVASVHVVKAHRRSRVLLHLFLTSALN